MTKPTKKAKKRNPNDATFRNINALKKRVKYLEFQVQILLEKAIADFSSAIQPKRKK